MERRLLLGIAVVVCLVQISECRPESMWKFPRGQREADPDFSCSDLSDRLGRFLNKGAVEWQGPFSFRQLIERVTSHDMLSESVRLQVVCRLTEATSVDELRAALDELGITHATFTFMYGAGTASIPLAISGLESALENPYEGVIDLEWYIGMMEVALDLLQQVDESGLDEWDPEATEWARVLLGLGRRHQRRSLGVQHSKYHSTRSVDACDRFSSNINSLVRGGILDNPNPGMGDMVARVQQWSGINCSNQALIAELACELLECTNVQDLIDLIDAHGISAYFQPNGYMFMVEAMRQNRRNMQWVVDEWENGSEIWGDLAPTYKHINIPLIDSLHASGLLSLSLSL